MTSKLARERRLTSRVRTTVKFEPVNQADVVVFYSQAMGQKLTPDQAVKLLKHSDGDFRNVLTAAVKAKRIMESSGIRAITDKVIDEVCKMIK